MNELSLGNKDQANKDGVDMDCDDAINDRGLTTQETAGS